MEIFTPTRASENLNLELSTKRGRRASGDEGRGTGTETKPRATETDSTDRFAAQEVLMLMMSSSSQPSIVALHPFTNTTRKRIEDHLSAGVGKVRQLGRAMKDTTAAFRSSVSEVI